MPDKVARPVNLTPPERTPRVFRPGPGMLILPVVILFALAGVGALILAGSHGTSPARTAPSGPPLSATDGVAAFTPLEHAGEPPADVLRQLPVPRAAVVVGRQDHDQDNGAYDRGVSMELDASYAQVVAFYQAQLASHHWVIVSTGPPRTGSGRQFLARRPSTDGFYWEVGAIVQAPSPTAHAGTPPTIFQLRLLEDEEEQ